MLPRELRKLQAIALREPTIMPMLPDRLQVSAPAWTYCACAPDAAMRAPDRTTAEASVRTVMGGSPCAPGRRFGGTVAQAWCRRPAAAPAQQKARRSQRDRASGRKERGGARGASVADGAAAHFPAPAGHPHAPAF